MAGLLRRPDLLPPEGAASDQSHPRRLNPRYLQAYTDRVDEKASKASEKAAFRSRHPYATSTLDSEHRHVQEFVVRNYHNAGGANQIPLLRAGDRYVKPQLLYRNITKQYERSEADPDRYVKPVSKESASHHDDAATTIQCCFRSYAARQRVAAQAAEHARRDRAAVRVQCKWRGRQGYAKFLLQRARNFQEAESASLIQNCFRGRMARNTVSGKRREKGAKEDAALGIQSLFRGRNARREAELKRRERGSLLASTNAWGESDNGLALIVDLGAVKSKYHFANVVTVKGGPAPSSPARGRKVGFSSQPAAKVTPKDGDDDGDSDNDDDDLLGEVKLESKSLAAQLARIELMAEQLEEDFAKTDQDLTTFKSKFDKDFATAKETTVSNRLNLLDYENELLRGRERQKKQQARKNKSATGGGSSAEKEQVSAEYLAADMEAESEMKAAWELLRDLDRLAANPGTRRVSQKNLK